MSEDKLLASWDVTEIAEHQVKYLMENPDDHEEIIGLSEDKVYELVHEDSIFWEIEWESLTECLTELMNERCPDIIYWRATVSGFGWRSLDGHKDFKAENGKELLQEILPKTDCTFWIYEYEEDGKKGLKINNCHHDSPIRGKEWYYIIPQPEEEDEDEDRETSEGVSSGTPVH